MPIALTDEALAHLCIAATAVEPRARRAWLLSLAHKIDPPSELSPTQRRQLAYLRLKTRESRGASVTGVTYTGRGLAKLILAGWLPNRDTYTNMDVGDAISDLLENGAALPPRT